MADFNYCDESGALILKVANRKFSYVNSYYCLIIIDYIP